METIKKTDIALKPEFFKDLTLNNFLLSFKTLGLAGLYVCHLCFYVCIKTFEFMAKLYEKKEKEAEHENK